jgi:hypothetical protein
MSDVDRRARDSWGFRSTVQAAGMEGRDCPDPGGGRGGHGGVGGGGGSGGGGGGHGDGGHCSCHCHDDHGQHQHGQGSGHSCTHPHGHHCCSCAHDDFHHGHHHDHHGHGRDRDKGDRPGRSGADHGSALPVGDDVTYIGWKNPRRPGRVAGTSAGRVPGGLLDPCDFGTPPWNQWPGDRSNLFLPYLFMRANAGDLGARPVVGPFWESPDVLLLAGAEPAVAPPVPPQLGDTALAGQPNTIYAHVWNFGLSAAPNVVVEFYWCDPSLGIGAGGAHLIGHTWLSLGARGSGRAHAVAKCPTPWVPTFINGGHECLLVRVWDETSDGLGSPPWDAALNRHIAQRNIHVVAAGNGMHTMRRFNPGDAITLPTPMAPLTLKVGPLYGEPAEVAVTRAAPHAMPWLQLRTGRGQFPTQAAPTGDVHLGAATPIGGGPSGGGAEAHQLVDTDEQQVTFTTGDTAPAPGEAHVYRVTASQQGEVFGGYTVVLLG